MVRWSIQLLWLFSVGFCTDYDIAVIGSSPYAILEATYHASQGKRVALFEKDSTYGGAWKAISVCGIDNVDLGCHTIGTDPKLNEFLERCFGCRMVPMDDPLMTSRLPSLQGYYFAGGCAELISRLIAYAEWIGVDLHLLEPVHTLDVDTAADHVRLELTHRTVSAAKVLLSPAAQVEFKQLREKTTYVVRYVHLYLLIDDPTPPAFAYQYLGKAGVNRAMNLTHFCGLYGTGRQLIAFQLNPHCERVDPEALLSVEKGKGLLSREATILRAEYHVFEQNQGTNLVLSQLAPDYRRYFELLNTSSFGVICQHVRRFTESFPFYSKSGT